jgi:hypothetical protein
MIPGPDCWGWEIRPAVCSINQFTLTNYLGRNIRHQSFSQGKCPYNNTVTWNQARISYAILSLFVNVGCKVF